MVMGELVEETQVLVVGGGPGGYAAAFRAADLGLDVTLVEKRERPGGECLFQGCIPSKTLLYLSELLYDAHHASHLGVTFGEPKIDLDQIRAFKNDVIDQLSTGLVNLTKRRGVQFIHGSAVFEGPDKVRLQGAEVSHIKFKHCILATGSVAAALPNLPVRENGRIMDSAGALALSNIPERLLVVGGGYVGLELGSVYAALGSKVTVVEVAPRLMVGADEDLVRPLAKRLGETFEAIYTDTRLGHVRKEGDCVKVTFEGDVEPKEQRFDLVLASVGRTPNSRDIGLDKAGVKLNDRGFVAVDDRQRTSNERIFAVGDVAGQPMLAHKAFREGKIAAEVIAGQPSAFDARAIPAVVFTDPQVAWAGLTEQEAAKTNRTVRVERFSWKHSSRAVTMDAAVGETKLLIDPETERILGMGIVGRNTEGMISEGVLAIEMGALATDLSLSIHPHPTLSETVSEAAGVFLGDVTHMMPKKKG